ncbi:histidine phosphatase family protein [Formicincola oecophyllae]|uniref:Histidine phosphatase family protein n=1 Tax=Formicincola oecophyllae TaxID=2558361 RepID=A0A4Y6UA85_9PROT|nr:histidine phosphatase family protein [Formicincola oecophyllae]QDH14373.1 histidine phosphatase family protein [Formicincola oecophyllae]
MPALVRRPFWYVRHGETAWNVRHLAQGRTDIPLNERGREQAREAGARLAALFANGQRPFTHIVSSPLSRARETAEAVRDAVLKAGGPALPITTDDGFLEVCFGTLEGKELQDWYKQWIEDGYVPPEGEGFHELQARSTAALNRAHQVGPGHNDDVPLIVAHGALFRGLRASMGMEINVRLANADPWHLSPVQPGSADDEGAGWKSWHDESVDVSQGV